MNEERIQAYIQLIEKLLTCKSGEENHVLNDNWELVEPKLLQAMAEVAEFLADNGRAGEANFLINLLLQVGEYLGSSQQPQTVRKQTADKLLGIGGWWCETSQFTLALQVWQYTLTIYREIKDRKGETSSLCNLGNTYGSLGQYERAIEYHQKDLTISKEIKDRQGEASSLCNLGSAYWLLGQYERAIEYYQKSLTIKREIKDRKGEASSLGNLGNAYLFLGQYERAIEYYQKPLTIAREIKDREGEAISLGNLGAAYHSLGHYEQAIKYQQQSLTIAREIKNRQGEAYSLNNLGIAHRKLSQTKEAIQAFQASLTIATPETMPNICTIAGRNLGNIHFSQGNWELAITGYEPTIKVAELVRNSSLTDDNRKQILEKNLIAYAKIVQCYINLEQYEKALEYADRSRSRFLTDLLYNKYLRSKGDIPPQVQEYLDLQQQIDSLRFNSPADGMMGEPSSTTASNEAKLEKIRQLGATQQQVLENIHRENKELAAQLQPTPLSFQQMQRLIPDRKTALLNFYSTYEDTFIFILRHPDAVGEIPPTSLGIKTEERSVTCYTCKGEGYEALQNWIWETWLDSYIYIKLPEFFVTAQLLNCKPEDIKTIETTDTAALVTLADDSQKTINISQELLIQTYQKRDQLWEEWQNQMQPTLAKLSQRLQLQQLIDNHLQDIEELIIVPHLYLHQIPFAALPISPKVAENPETTAPVLQTAGKTRDYRNFDIDTSDTTPTTPISIDNNEYLSDRFRIRVVPSCQILDFCHQREAIKTKTVGIV